MLSLRPYQHQAITELRAQIKSGNNRVILCAATGAGKTVIFSFMASGAVAKGKRVLIITHRTELFTQAGGALSGLGLNPIDLDRSAKRLPKANLYVGMAQTLKRRLSKPEYQEWYQSVDLIIIDEAHLCEFEFLLDQANPDTIMIGATATPIRTGRQPSLHLNYQGLVNPVQISDLIQQGYLSKPNYYGFGLDLSKVKTKGGDYDSDNLGDFMSEKRLFKGVVENYNRLTPNTKAIIFAPNIKSSLEVVAEFNANGIEARHVDGYIDDRVRKANLKWFKETPNAVLSNMGILTAGYDEPTIETVILYRATKSLSLYMQMVGRGSRVTDTKSAFNILDFGNNVYTHGFWHSERTWSLEKVEKPKGVAPVKYCDCGAIIPQVARVCEYCGAEQPKTPQQIREELYLELEKITAKDLDKWVQVSNFEKLEQFAEFKSYKKQWIVHRLKPEQLKDYAEYKAYDARWVLWAKKIKGV
jgi:superfamily II DNA or RNA helicase